MYGVRSNGGAFSQLAIFFYLRPPDPIIEIMFIKFDLLLRASRQYLPIQTYPKDSDPPLRGHPERDAFRKSVVGSRVAPIGRSEPWNGSLKVWARICCVGVLYQFQLASPGPLVTAHSSENTVELETGEKGA